MTSRAAGVKKIEADIAPMLHRKAGLAASKRPQKKGF
jgi:hypothetical protein